MKQALIPAAGTGSRLGQLTKNKPKCMIEINGYGLGSVGCIIEVTCYGLGRQVAKLRS